LRQTASSVSLCSCAAATRIRSWLLYESFFFFARVETNCGTSYMAWENACCASCLLALLSCDNPFGCYVSLAVPIPVQNTQLRRTTAHSAFNKESLVQPNDARRRHGILVPTSPVLHIGMSPPVPFPLSQVRRALCIFLFLFLFSFINAVVGAAKRPGSLKPRENWPIAQNCTLP